MAGDIALLTADMLLHAVLRSGLMMASYIDDHGEKQPAGLLFVVQVISQCLLPCYCLHFKSHIKLRLIFCFSPPPQHLFLTFPRIVFMLGFLVFVFFLLAGYALFHSYLAVVNQTSNEWYKTRGYVCQHCHPTVTADNLCDLASDHSKRYYYSRGVLRNLREIFLPPQPVHKKDN